MPRVGALQLSHEGSENMKNIAKLAVIGALAAFGAAQANAQTSVVQNVTITLAGWKDGGKVKILTKDVISSLGGAKGDKLIFVTSGDTNGAVQGIFIRPKGKKDASADVEVTSAFVIPPDSTEAGPVTVNKTDYQIDEFEFTNASGTNEATLRFEVEGLTTLKSKTVKKKSFSADVETVNATVNGDATIAGDLAIVKGKVRVVGGKAE